MKLEFFDGEPAPDRLRARADRGHEPTVLLYGDRGDEVARLRAALRPLTESVDRSLAIHELSFVESVDGCSLIACSGPRVVGVTEGRAPRSFTWTYDPLTWLQTYELLEPFEQIEPSSNRFQFLSEGHGPRVIFSTCRGW